MDHASLGRLIKAGSGFGVSAGGIFFLTGFEIFKKAFFKGFQSRFDALILVVLLSAVSHAALG